MDEHIAAQALDGTARRCAASARGVVTMYRDHTVGVVVPAYNEEGFVGDVIESMPAYVDRVYVIDDASTDGTWAEIRRHAARVNDRGAAQAVAVSADPGDTDATVPDGFRSVEPDGGVAEGARVVPIRHETNTGVGGAIKTGYKRAQAEAIDVTAVMGGDGQMDPAQLSRLLDPIVAGKADYAKGNRLLAPEYRADMPRLRLIGNTILTFLTKIASGYWKTMDPQNGYTAISSEALDAVDLDGMYEYYGYCNDLLVKLNAAGMRVSDVGMPAKYAEEESDISYSRYIPKVSGMLFRNFIWRLQVKYLVVDFHPLALFYMVGVLVVLLGVGLSGWTLATLVGSGGDLFLRTALSVLVVATGALFLLWAMVFDMRVNADKEVQIRE